MNLLSDEILITELLPQFSITGLKNLAVVSKRMNEVCLDETLWQFKTQREYPQLVKGDEISWREFYLLICSGSLVPLYYRGDRIATIPYHPRLISSLMKLLQPHISEIGFKGRVALIDSRRIPVLMIQCPVPEFISLRVDRQVEKILLVEAEGKIFQELVSEHGHPPVYGMYKSNKFHLIDNRTGLGKFKAFENWGYRDLVQILYLLGMTLPHPEHQVDPVVRRRLVSEAFQLDGLNDEQVDFYFSWLVSRVSRKELSELISEKLKEIGHLV